MKAKEKIPCITCKDGCQNIFDLYNLYHLLEGAPETKMLKMRVQCQRLNVCLEVDLRSE